MWQHWTHIVQTVALVLAVVQIHVAVPELVAPLVVVLVVVLAVVLAARQLLEWVVDRGSEGNKVKT